MISEPTFNIITKSERGFDRRPTADELECPPDKRPWTEYDQFGNPQARPPYKACGLYCPFFFLPFGCPCLVCEIEWPECCGCGPDADQCCDVCCRCRLGRMPIYCCCGPQCNEACKDSCCCCCGGESCCTACCRNSRVAGHECCDCCDCCYHHCAPRYSGCKVLCCHVSCVCCPRGWENCWCCSEERIMMDGDLVRI